MSQTAYHLRHWDEVYETYETRKLRNLTFYAKPNKLMGEGINLTLLEEDNAALYGTWTLLEVLASTTSPREHRGWLVRNGTPLTPARISALIRVRTEIVERTLEWFSRPEIGWLEKRPWKSTLTGESPADVPELNETSTLTGESPADARKREREREVENKEREKRERGSAAHSSAAPGLLLSEVLDWAKETSVDPEFAELKFRQASERGDFAKAGWSGDRWKDKFRRFWDEDGSDWLQKKKKKRAPGAGVNGHEASRPDGWKDGDQEFWWTDAVESVRGLLTGAARIGDKETATRLREILKERETA